MTNPQSPPTRDFKYLLTLSERVASPELKTVVDVFVKNFERALHLEHLPFSLVKEATYEAFIQSQAHINIHGELFKHGVPDDDGKIEAEIKRLEGDNAGWWASRKEALMQYATQLVQWQLFGPKASPVHRRTSNTILVAILLNGWTAFEVLAGDLWETALNSRPQILLEALKNQPQRTANEITSDRGLHLSAKKQVIDLYVDDLVKCAFDLRGHLGAVLRKRYSFIGLDSIRDAYLGVFGNLPEISQIFDHRVLRSLSAVRNLFVHKAGKVDQEFIEKAAGDSVFSGLKIGDAIEIKERSPNLLLDAAVSQSLDLIKFVDEWMVKSKPLLNWQKGTENWYSNDLSGLF
jgi:hypothetical protein